MRGGGEEDEGPCPGPLQGARPPTVGSSAGAWRVKVRGLHGPDPSGRRWLWTWNVSSLWGEEPERVREVELPVRPGGATS